MKEKTNISQFELFPEGNYEFIVAEKPEKFKNEKSTWRKWKFYTIIDGNKKTYSTVLFPWNSMELLVALGGVLCEDNTVEWDDDEVEGKKINATIVHEKDRNGIMRANMMKISSIETGEDLPF